MATAAPARIKTHDHTSSCYRNRELVCGFATLRRGHVSAVISDEAVAETQKAILQEALKISRNEGMFRIPSRAHLAAMQRSREELLAALKEATGMLDAFIHEVEVSTASLPDSKKKLAGIQKIQAEQEAM